MLFKLKVKLGIAYRTARNFQSPNIHEFSNYNFTKTTKINIELHKGFRILFS